MSTITVKDGTTIYYKDWGKGPVVTFSHGWPLNADAWDGQMNFFVQQGFPAGFLNQPNLNPAAGMAELDRVFDQVIEDLPHL